MGTQVEQKLQRAPASRAALTDHELVSAVLRKDRKATAEFVERFADGIYRYLRARLFPRPDRVEDLFQETFLAAWEHLSGFRGDSSLEAWLMGIARHKVEDFYRARLREALPLDEDSQELPSGQGGEFTFNAELDDAKRSRKIVEVLQMLPETYSTVLVWRYWEKCSAKDMAQMSGRSEKAIERLLARARALFRERWQGE